MRYEIANEVFERLCSNYPGNVKYIKENEVAIKNYFMEKLQENEEVIVTNYSEFWRCRK